MMRQGDPGEELYVLLEGEARAYRNFGTDAQIYLSTMRPVSYIGEIAILDQAARSATVQVSEDARLLTLGAEPFRELIIQTPEISFEVFRVLTERIRTAERRDSEA
jgi:CRP/FNR family cyclic AMP-dependent transcriptional regulator